MAQLHHGSQQSGHTDGGPAWCGETPEDGAGDRPLASKLVVQLGRDAQVCVLPFATLSEARENISTSFLQQKRQLRWSGPPAEKVFVRRQRSLQGQRTADQLLGQAGARQGPAAVCQQVPADHHKGRAQAGRHIVAHSQEWAERRQPEQ